MVHREKGETDTDTDRYRDRDTQRERDRQNDRQNDRQTDRQRWVKVKVYSPIVIVRYQQGIFFVLVSTDVSVKEEHPAIITSWKPPWL